LERLRQDGKSFAFRKVFAWRQRVCLGGPMFNLAQDFALEMNSPLKRLILTDLAGGKLA